MDIPLALMLKESVVFEATLVPKDFEEDLVITLCGDARDKCPIFKSKTEHIHWGIEDPAVFIGDEDETYMKYEEVRDIIFDKISQFKNKLRNI